MSHNLSASNLGLAALIGLQGLKYEDCDLLGMNSLLQVNEVFERF